MNGRMLSKMFYVDESGIHGKGLFARVHIKKGHFLGTYEGPETTDLESPGDHVLWVEEEDGSWLGRDGENMLRYLNHHEEPTAEFDGFDLFAIADITPGSEVTIHYGEEFVEAISVDSL
jgi:uncharacterized protein